MSAITEITDHINTTLRTAAVVGGTDFFGISRQIESNGVIFPACEISGKAEPIYPDRGVPLKIYHKLDSEIQWIELEGTGFGIDLEKSMTYDLGIYGIGIRDRIFNDGKMSTWDLGMAVADALPSGQFAVSSNIKKVALESFALETRDHLILSTEYRGTDFQKDQLDIVAFRIRITVTAEICGNFCE